VRQHRSSHQVTNREYSLNIGAEVIIDDDSSRSVEGNTDILQTRTLG
jgi:hypothetical protein